jgi:hypothetical protein
MAAIEIPSWMQQEDTDWDTVEDIPSHKFYDGSIDLYFDPGKHEYYRYDAEGDRVEVPGCTTVLKTAIDKSQMLMPWATKLVIDTLKLRMFHSDGSLKSYSTEELNQWFAEAKDKHKERLDAAGDIGHTAHDALERTIQYAIDHTEGKVIKLFGVSNPDGTEAGQMAQSCFEAGIDWIHKHDVTFLHTERKVYSREYDVAGTLDGIGLVSSCDEMKCCRGKVFHQVASVIDWKSSNALRDEYAIQTGFYLFAHLEEMQDVPVHLRFILRLGKLDGKFEPWLIGPEFFADDLDTFLAALVLYRSLKSLEERRRKDKAELRAVIKVIRDEARAIQDAKDRAERLAAREASKLATKERNEALDAEYKALRKSGMSAAEAKLQVWPKKSQNETVLESNIEPTVPALEIPYSTEWVMKL